MQTIAELIKGLGCKQGSGPNFYLPEAHPHVHIGVDNASASVNDLNAVRPHIKFIALSWGDLATQTVQLYSRDRGKLEDKKYLHSPAFLNQKTAFEKALHEQIGVANAIDIQKMLNLLTGIGIDI